MTTEKRRRMISDAKHRYNGRVLSSGDRFECSDEEADDLKAINFAHDAPEEEPTPKRVYQRRDMTAEK